MKYRLILSALITAFIFQFPTLSVAQNKIDNQGRRQGHWIKTDKDGSRIFEGDFVDGKETGTFNYYYPDGTLKISNTYTEPGRYCSHKAYDEKGHLLATGYYNQKNRDSVWHFYNEEGRLIKVASYKMGVNDGTHIVLAANGDTAEISTWSDNHRHGRWWKRIGTKGYITARYENGMMQGRLIEYNDQGKMVRDGFYKNGQKDGAYRYYENGTRTVDEVWQAGVLADRKILLHTPTERWQSVFGIAYYMPKGSSGTTVYLNDGTKLPCTEMPDVINERAGHDLFVLIDQKSRLMSNIGSVVGVAKDEDGRETLELSPKAPFTIFPDENCIKMIKSLKRLDELDE